MSSKKTGKTSRTAISTKSRGLGDTIEKVTKKTGVKKAVKWLLGEDCGCDNRKDYLNKLFPYNRPECLTEEEYEYLKGWYSVKRVQVSPDQQRRLLAINNRVFHERREPCSSCGGAFGQMLDRLKKVYDVYGLQP